MATETNSVLGTLSPFIKAAVHVGIAANLVVKDEPSDADRDLAMLEVHEARKHLAGARTMGISQQTRDNITMFVNDLDVARENLKDQLPSLVQRTWTLASQLDYEYTGMTTVDDGQP